MWSAVRPATARGLRVGPAVKVKALVTATRTGSVPIGRVVAAHSRVAAEKRALWVRGFASTAVSNAPKAATKVATKARATKKKTVVKKKPVAKKAAAKKKPVKKAKKPAKKVKVVAKKRRVRKELTPEAKKKLQVKELKKVALFNEPAKLPEQPWILYVTESTKGVKSDNGRSGITTRMRVLAQSFKEISHSERERLQNTSAANREANAAAYKAWVESYTPVDIATANAARKHLNRLRTSRCSLIRDERQPKRPWTAYLLYAKARWDSGDLAGQSTPDATKLIAAEWNSLPASERQQYEASAKVHFDRYEKDVRSILGREVGRG